MKIYQGMVVGKYYVAEIGQKTVWLSCNCCGNVVNISKKNRKFNFNRCPKCEKLAKQELNSWEVDEPDLDDWGD